MGNIWDTWRQIRWNGNIECVFCKARQYRRHSIRRSGLFRYRCLNCCRIFSDVSGTFLQSSKVSLEKWRIAAEFYVKNRQSNLRILQQILKLSYPTVLRIMCLLRRIERNRQLKIDESNENKFLFI